MPVNLTPVSGVVVEVSAAAPAAFTAVGYNALTFTAFNDYDNVPTLLGGYEMQSFDGVREGQTRYRGLKVGRTETFRVPDDATDAGLVIVKAAFDAAKGSAAEKISIRTRDENDRYQAAQIIVGDYSVIYGGANDIKLREITIGVIAGTEVEGTDS